MGYSNALHHSRITGSRASLFAACPDCGGQVEDIARAEGFSTDQYSKLDNACESLKTIYAMLDDMIEELPLWEGE